jgi:TRAP-type C4-dicarboxylate transport system permease large subunit
VFITVALRSIGLAAVIFIGIVAAVGIVAAIMFLPAVLRKLDRAAAISTGIVGAIGIVAAIVMVAELGLIHPPVGMNIFVIKRVLEDAKISTIFYGVLPFIFTDILRLILLIAFPILALWLPSKMG